MEISLLSLGMVSGFRERFGDRPDIGVLDAKSPKRHDPHEPLIVIHNRQASNLMLSHDLGCITY